MKKGGGGDKGRNFERQICKKLSLWWSGGERDDIFWRTDGSGGRATQRRKIGKDTYGQEGDVRASDPIGKELLEVCTIELKIGYGKKVKEAKVGWNFIDTIDRNKKDAKYTIEDFVAQAKKQCKSAGSISWIIIAQRDRRKEIVIMPIMLADILFPDEISLAMEEYIEFHTKGVSVICISLETFLRSVDREDFLRIHKNYRLK